MFMLFTGQTFYPSGGWGDFRGFYMTIEDAKRIAKAQRDDWYQVVGNTQEGAGILDSGNIEDL